MILSLPCNFLQIFCYNWHISVYLFITNAWTHFCVRIKWIIPQQILIYNSNTVSSPVNHFLKFCNPENPLFTSETHIYKHVDALSSLNGRTAWRQQLKDKIYFAMERHFNWIFWNKLIPRTTVYEETPGDHNTTC